MSTIADQFRTKKRAYYLLVCDFGGLIKRYSTKDINVGDYHFAGKIKSIGNVGTQFDLMSFRYSVSSVGVTIINDERLQDEESRRVLDGSTCKIYIWCEGLAWSDIETDGLIFTGVFKKNSHSDGEYSFSLDDAGREMRMVPGSYINDTTFASHRKEGGGGSVSGKPMPLIFGDFPGGIPLLCVDTSNFYYMAALGIVKSADADYTATTENVKDKDGAVVAAAGYTLKTGITDGRPYTYFDFTGDQVASEGLTCSIKGIKDGSGDITGTANGLIEHPADMLRFLVDNYAIDRDPHLESIGTMRSVLAGLKFAAYVNSPANAADVAQRLLPQCQCSIITHQGKIGVMVFDPFADAHGRYRKKSNTIGTVSISKTPFSNICNHLTVNYRRNMASGQYEGQLTIDRTNSEACRLSYYEYGERPEVVLDLPDIQTEDNAYYVANRHIAIHSHRHDIVSLVEPYADGFDLREGDPALWRIPEGTSRDGKGFIDEKMILLDRQFLSNGISQRWWRSRFNMDYGGSDVASGGYVRDHTGAIVLDADGQQIRDSFHGGSEN